MEPSPEIEAVVRRFLAARAAGDASRISNLFSDSPNFRMIGTDSHEWYRGPEASEQVMSAHWEAFGDWHDTVVRLEAFEAGEAGWAAVEGRRNRAEGEEYTYRLTISLHLDQGSWRFTQLHYSVPVSNQETSGAELTQTLSDLLDSFTSGEDRLDLNLGTSTIVFTDIVDSTPLSASMSESAWSKLVTDHFDVLRRAVAAESGVVVKTLGDGAMFAFKSASAALNAASRVQRQVKDDPIQLRIGIHTGDVVYDRDDYIGFTVAMAARVAAAARGGEVLLSAATANLVNERDYEMGEPRTFELKGIGGTHQLRPLFVGGR